jgi:hypothetical protein
VLKRKSLGSAAACALQAVLEGGVLVGTFEPVGSVAFQGRELSDLAGEVSGRVSGDVLGVLRFYVLEGSARAGLPPRGTERGRVGVARE